jgi:hypothetical protein
MDVITIEGTIPTLWPLFMPCVCGSGSMGKDRHGPYENLTADPENSEGLEAYRLDVKQARAPDEVTRALQDIDSINTTGIGQ